MAYTTINKPTDNFNTKLYTGTGATNAITGVGFQPDFVWTKRRDSTSGHHVHNSISGATKYIFPNDTAAESTDANKLASFDSDGFTVGTNGDANASGGTFASWNFKGGGTGVSNTDGSTNTVVSANTTSGFSIVTYSGNSTAGSTFGHGLGVKPSMIITKARTRASMWNVYHKGLTNYTKGIYLNATDAEFAGGAFADGEPNANTFTLSNGTHVNGSGETYVAYCFAEKQGYSKFGSYTGNGNADGTFVYTGFKPAWIMIKNASSSSEEWNIWDNKRNTFNVMTTRLVANINAADSVTSAGFFDFTSNGFKIRSTANGVNQSGSNLIYMAFAEAPLVGTNGVTAKAR